LAKRSQGGKLECVPRKIRQLIADLERAGFVPVSGGKDPTASSGMRRSREP